MTELNASTPAEPLSDEQCEVIAERWSLARAHENFRLMITESSAPGSLNVALHNAGSDIEALLTALKKSRSGARELGQIVVFLTDLMKDAFQRGGSDPIGALHMLGNHLGEALVSDEDADEFNRAYRALEQRRDEVKRLRADLEQCRSMLRQSERTAADLKGQVERQRGQDEKLLAELERDQTEAEQLRAALDGLRALTRDEDGNVLPPESELPVGVFYGLLYGEEAGR